MALEYPSLAKMWADAQTITKGQMDLAEAQRKQQAASRLRDLFASAGGADLGSPTTLREIMKIDPETGLGYQKTLADLAKTQAETGYKQAQTAKAGMDAASTKQNFVIEGARRVRQYIDTLPPDQHQAALEQVYPSFVASLRQTGAFSPEELDDMLQKGPDMKAFYAITGGGMAYDVQKQRQMNEAEANKPMTPYQEQSLRVQRDRLNLERDRFNRQGGGMGAPPSGYRFTPDGNLAPIPGGPADKPTAKQPTYQQTKEITGYLDRQDTLNRLADTFNEGYAGSPVLGQAENWIGRTLGDPFDKGQAQWWQDYQSYINEVRHSLFGGALTATEKAEFDRAMVQPGMNPDQVRQNLTRQKQIVDNAIKRRMNIYGGQGYDMSSFGGEATPDMSVDVGRAGGRQQQTGGPIRKRIRDKRTGQPMVLELRNGAWVQVQ
jgi:hypothetical protein